MTQEEPSSIDWHTSRIAMQMEVGAIASRIQETAEDYETFSVRIPRKIARYIRAIAEYEERSPESFIAEGGAGDAALTLDDAQGSQDDWRKAASAANPR